MFKAQTDLYSQFDSATGIPTHDKAGEPLSKAATKKLQKEYQKQQELHEKYLAKVKSADRPAMNSTSTSSAAASAGKGDAEKPSSEKTSQQPEVAGATSLVSASTAVDTKDTNTASSNVTTSESAVTASESVFTPANGSETVSKSENRDSVEESGSGERKSEEKKKDKCNIA
jgi:hypothetical protein